MTKITGNIYKKLIVLMLILGFCWISPAISFGQDIIAADHSNLSARISIYMPSLQKAFEQALSRTDLLSQAVTAAKLSAPEHKADINPPIPTKKYLVLFICNGNQVRSPMGRWLTNKNMPEDLRDYFIAESAGLRDPVNDHVLNEFLSRHEYLRIHSPHKVRDDQLEEAKIIYVMTKRQRNKIIDKYPFLADKTFLLMGDADENGLHAGNGDYTKSGKTYQTLQKVITERLPFIYKQMRGVLAQECAQSQPMQSEPQTIHPVALNVSLINTAI